MERFWPSTRVDRSEHLIANHFKLWRESAICERFFEGNGLLLTPTIDHLFDRGFISLENNGVLLISPVAHDDSMKKMGIITDRVVNVGEFAEPQSHPLRLDRGENKGEVSKFVPRSSLRAPNSAFDRRSTAAMCF